MFWRHSGVASERHSRSSATHGARAKVGDDDEEGEGEEGAPFDRRRRRLHSHHHFVVVAESDSLLVPSPVTEEPYSMLSVDLRLDKLDSRGLRSEGCDDNDGVGCMEYKKKRVQRKRVEECRAKRGGGEVLDQSYSPMRNGSMISRTHKDGREVFLR